MITTKILCVRATNAGVRRVTFLFSDLGSLVIQLNVYSSSYDKYK